MKTLFKLPLLLGLFSLLLQGQNQEIYISDAGGFDNPSPPWQILKYDSNGENPQVFIDEEIAWPQDILFLEDDNVVLISNLQSNRITIHNTSTGEYIEDFATVNGGPTRIKIGQDGLLYVLQWSDTDNHVLRFELDGTFVDTFTTVGVPRSIGIDWDSNENLYVSSYTGFVQKFDSSGNDSGVFINSELTGPTNIWIDDNDHMFVFDWLAGDIESFDENGNYTGTFIDNLSQPEGIAFLPNGNMLIGNGGTSAIKLFEPDGTFIEDFIPSGLGSLAQPNAVVLRESELATEEHNTVKPIFVTPSVGRLFLLQKQEAQTPLTVYDIHGKVVDTLQPTNQTVWNANHLSEGLYFISLQKAQKTTTQKIIVKD